MGRWASFCKLDIFAKVDASFTRSSSTGGTVSLLTYVLIVLLLLFQIYDFLNPDITLHYSIDSEFDKKLNINVDITVATPCNGIGADIMDSTNKHSLYTYGELREQNVQFALNDIEKVRWEKSKLFNSYFRQQHHNLHRLIWKPGSLNKPQLGPQTEDRFYHDPAADSCRFSGTLTVNKVSGNFHITAGKYLPMPIGHAHVSLLGSDRAVNFSHRIEKLSFGDDLALVVNTLDGVEKITNSNTQLYQYYLKVVLTDVDTVTYQTQLYQYSVSERELIVNHDAGNHGIPGIYFKYDIDGLKVKVRQQRIPTWKFMVQLCAIVGGLWAISGYINQLATHVVDVITCKYISNININ